MGGRNIKRLCAILTSSKSTWSTTFAMRVCIIKLRRITPLNRTEYQSDSIEHYSRWHVVCYLVPNCQSNFGHRQSQRVCISRIAFLIQQFRQILLPSSCGTGVSQYSLIFVFLGALLMSMSPKKSVRGMGNQRFRIGDRIAAILWGMTNPPIYSKYGIHLMILLSANGMSFSMKLSIFRERLSMTLIYLC